MTKESNNADLPTVTIRGTKDAEAPCIKCGHYNAMIGTGRFTNDGFEILQCRDCKAEALDSLRHHPCDGCYAAGRKSLLLCNEWHEADRLNERFNDGNADMGDLDVPLQARRIFSPAAASLADSLMEAQAGDKVESEEGEPARDESTTASYHASDYRKVAADYEHVRGVVVGIIGGAYSDKDEAESELGVDGIITDKDIEGMPWGRDQHDGVWVGIGVSCIQERLRARAAYLDDPKPIHNTTFCDRGNSPDGYECELERGHSGACTASVNGEMIFWGELFAKAEPQGKTFTLKPGQHLEDVYIFYPRERDTIIAALRLWQKVMRASSFYASLLDGLDDIATNGGIQNELDENEIDILIEDKLQISVLSDDRAAQSTGAGESGEAPAPLDPEDAVPTGDGFSRMFYKADAIGIVFRFDIPTHMIPESYDMLTYRLDDGLVHFWGPRGGHIAEVVPLRLAVEHMGAIEQDDLAIPRSLTRDCKVCGKRHPKNSTGCSTYPASWDTVACAGGCGSQVPIGSEAVDAKYCSDCYNKGVR